MIINEKDKIIIPKDIEFVIEKLNAKGFEAYLVGGCVRDSVIGREPCDWDITTDALPEEIKKIFEKTYDTGIKHGTVTVLLDTLSAEVTTYRIDGQYLDNRRPDSVEFTKSLKEDLARRDFTVNSMAYSPKEGLIDYFGGLEDLKQERIKAVGNACARFNEDALRMLRAIRFSAQLGFIIETDTLDAIRTNSSLIKNISPERIRDELDKLLTSKNPGKFNLLFETGLLEHLIPEFVLCYYTEQNNPYHVYNVAEHIIHTLEYIEQNSILRWTMLLHDIGKPPQKTTDDKGIDHFYGHQEKSEELAEIILNRLRFDKESIKNITRLVLYHDLTINEDGKSIRKVANKVGEEWFLELLKVQKADAMAQNRIYLEERLIKQDNIKEKYNLIKNSKQCLSKRNMALNGDDLIMLGMKPGKEMGKIIDYLFEQVLENPKLNEKQKLIELAKQMTEKEFKS